MVGYFVLGLHRTFRVIGSEQVHLGKHYLAKRHRAASPRSLIMKKRSTLAAGCGLFVSLVFVGAAQAQSAQDFVNKVAISDMFEIQSSQLALSKQPDRTPSHSHRKWSRITRRHQKN